MSQRNINGIKELCTNKMNEYLRKEKLNQFLSKKNHKVGVLTKGLFVGKLLEAHFRSWT